jgi:DNA-binding transcriptional MerR regulator
MITAEEQELSAQRRAGGKSEAAFRTISEVSEDLDVPQHVLRFWESKFPQIKPLKRGGGRRYYRPEDVALLRRIRDLLYKDGYTIKGVQKLLREQGKAGADEAAASAVAAPEASTAAAPAAAASAAPSPRTPVARPPRSRVELPPVEAEEEIILAEPDLPPAQHHLFDLDTTELVEDASAIPAIEEMEEAEEFELPERVWIQPAPPPPIPPHSPHFRPGDRVQLISLLGELEELRDLLSASRRG